MGPSSPAAGPGAPEPAAPAWGLLGAAASEAVVGRAWREVVAPAAAALGLGAAGPEVPAAL